MSSSSVSLSVSLLLVPDLFRHPHCSDSDRSLFDPHKYRLLYTSFRFLEHLQRPVLHMEALHWHETSSAVSIEADSWVISTVVVHRLPRLPLSNHSQQDLVEVA